MFKKNKQEATSNIEKYESKKEKMNKVIKKIIIAIGIIILNLIIIFGIIVCINRFNTNVYKNIYSLDSNFSGKNENEVLNYLNKISKDKFGDIEIEIYQNDKNIFAVKSSEIEFELDTEKTAEKILQYGRNNNLLKDNFNIIKALVKPQNILPVYKYNNELLEETLKNLDLTLEGRAVDDTFSIDEKSNKLIVVRGKAGNSINENKVKTDIIESLKLGKSSTYKLELISKKQVSIDPDEVYKDIKREPKDAYVDETSTPKKYISEVNGLDLDLNDLKSFLDKEENKEEGKTLEYQLILKEPKVKLANLTYMLYKDKLDGYTTYFNAYDKARSRNLEIALGYLNGIVIMPGETFSYNKIIGDTTSAKGYQPAATFKGGTVVQELGGGICQTSSTLYNVALRSNLEIVQRHPHGLPVGYVKPSLDATVYGNILDLKFKNTRQFPIKIVTSYSPTGNMNISIYGTKEENEYTVALSSKVINYIPYNTQYIYDNNLAENKQEIVSKGVNGYTSESYITKSLNGKQVSSKLLSRDTYKAQIQIVKIGTKKTAPVNNNNGNNPVDIY